MHRPTEDRRFIYCGSNASMFAGHHNRERATEGHRASTPTRHAGFSSEMGHPLKNNQKKLQTRTATDSRGMHQVLRLTSNCSVRPLRSFLSTPHQHSANMRAGGLLDRVLLRNAFGFGRLRFRLRQVCAMTYCVLVSLAHPSFRNQLVTLIGSPASAQLLRLVYRSWTKLKLTRSCHLRSFT